MHFAFPLQTPILRTSCPSTPPSPTGSRQRLGPAAASARRAGSWDRRLGAADRARPAPARRWPASCRRSTICIASPDATGLHTLYISPLKALAVDVARNLDDARSARWGCRSRSRRAPATRPASRRQRQRYDPPNILLTTPEQLALLLSHERQRRSLFGGLRRIVLDELHALVTNKRGELLSLGIARIATLAPELRITALSAPPSRGPICCATGSPRRCPTRRADLLIGAGRREARPLDPRHRRARALGRALGALRRARALPDHQGAPARRCSSSTPARQAEMLFQDLWAINDDGIAIALHHGSLAVEQRRKVESAMVAGKLQAVVCTSTLDLGIDWGDVDLVVQVGAPKGASPHAAAHRPRQSPARRAQSKALFVPSNRFEVLECEAALEAVEQRRAGQRRPGLRRPRRARPARPRHGLRRARSIRSRFYEEVRRAWPYRDLELGAVRARRRFRRHRRLRAARL